jgi:hypothetical protein
MVKAKLGDPLRSKTDTAMVNEALCKILCHNLCCLVQSAYELGVTATFWGKEVTPLAAKTEDYDAIDAMAWMCSDFILGPDDCHARVIAHGS